MTDDRDYDDDDRAYDDRLIEKLIDERDAARRDLDAARRDLVVARAVLRLIRVMCDEADPAAGKVREVREVREDPLSPAAVRDVVLASNDCCGDHHLIDCAVQRNPCCPRCPGATGQAARFTHLYLRREIT